ncbi:hypothetical protein ASG41_11065 [Modestobacter sp. Leaf380]|nr:hypothetical protein ASG41_11065 [Modestobacter sp. Leaf380]
MPPIPDEAFERFARLVRHQLGVPVSLVSLVDEDRQVFPGAVGLPEPWATTRTTPLTHSFCQHVVTSREPLVIADARLDPLVVHNLAIPDLGVIGYAGIPLTDVDGDVIGSLCAIDHQPHAWTALEIAVLTDLAAACSSELQLRQLQARTEQTATVLAERGRQARMLLRTSSLLNQATTTTEIGAAVGRLAGQGFGADTAVVCLATEHTRELRPLAVEELTAASRAAWRGVSVDADHPAARTLADRVERQHRDAGELLAAFPGLAGRLPATWQADLHLPLDLGPGVTGVLSLSWPVTRELDTDVRTTARAFAGFVSQGLQRAMLLEDRRSTAETLQLAMLTDLPAPTHLQLAARYVPSSAEQQVGGDWYDALITPDGTTVLAIGDVTGHDMSAAAAMGQLRTLLRGLAHDREEPPASTLTRLDTTAAGLGVGTLATVVVARVEADGRLRWSNAGHPPPVLLHADGRVELLETRPEMLLGLDLAVPRTDHVVDLPPDSTLLLYTDGLVESRTQDLDVGTASLLAAVHTRRHQPLDELLDGLLRDLAHGRDDDIALLAVRAAPAG